MSFGKLFHIIDGSFIGEFVSKKSDIVKSTNPNKFYVENIRSFFNIPRPLAKFFLELGVKQGVYTKGIEIICPYCGRAVMQVKDISKVPNVISCELCELQGNEEYTFTPAKRNLIEFYSLNRRKHE